MVNNKNRMDLRGYGTKNGFVSVLVCAVWCCGRDVVGHNRIGENGGHLNVDF